jgi:hypothetical protein
MRRPSPVGLDPLAVLGGVDAERRGQAQAQARRSGGYLLKFVVAKEPLSRSVTSGYCGAKFLSKQHPILSDALYPRNLSRGPAGRHISDLPPHLRLRAAASAASLDGSG